MGATRRWVSDFVHQGPHEMYTQAANRTILDRAIQDGGRGLLQRIEGFAVIREDGGQMSGFRAQPQADLVGQVVVVTIGDDIGQQFVQNQLELLNVLDREGTLLTEGLDLLRELGDIPRVVPQRKTLFQDHDI